MRPYNRAARTRLPSESDGRITPERRVAETLSYIGFVDAAWELYERSGDETLLRRTCADERIDQLWASMLLRDAITDYQLLDSPPDASDHHGLVVVLDLARAATDNV
ncbi:hypothetical protein [Streptomyces sp. C10-9-1]|uniref:hypothetical protein n=1 Tax=Streptomyces sp. C10-9-1 TaxID=1859285 RepID=UPI003D72672B